MNVLLCLVVADATSSARSLVHADSPVDPKRVDRCPARQAERDSFAARWQALLGNADHSCGFERLLHDACNGAWVSDALQVIYIENQKAASRSILSWMNAAGKVRLTLLPYHGSRRAASQERAANHCGPKNASSALPHDYVVFTFVREPVASFVSAAFHLLYLFKTPNDYATCETSGESLRRAAWPCAESDDGPRFLRNFILDVNASRSLGAEAFHVWPQMVKIDILPENRSLDFVGRVEHFEEDFVRLRGLAATRLAGCPNAGPGVAGCADLNGRAAAACAREQLRCRQVLRTNPHANAFAKNAPEMADCAAAAKNWLLESDLLKTVCALVRVDVGCLPGSQVERSCLAPADPG